MMPTESDSKAAPTGFFVIRTPLLPIEELLDWSAGLEAAMAVGDPARLEQALASDRVTLQHRLRQMVSRGHVLEALFIASPSLVESLPAWIENPQSKRGWRVERALVRYCLRMMTRPTPFGLFAGCSLGYLGRGTSLALDGRAAYRRHSRLDMDYLSNLAEELSRVPALGRSLTYRPNSSLYGAAGRLRYAQSAIKDGRRSYHLVAVDVTDYLEATLARAAHGASPHVLASHLAERDAEVTLEEATAYVQELIENQVLVPDLAPPVTGDEPIHDLLRQLRDHAEAAVIAGRLQEAQRSLEALDQTEIGARPEVYRATARLLEALPAKVEISRLFQVDLRKPCIKASLGEEPLAEIARGISILHRLGLFEREDRLERFRTSFVERYGEREVPLLQALDEEVGADPSRSTRPATAATPLLEGLDFPELQEETTKWRKFHASLLFKCDEARRIGAYEIDLDRDALEELKSDDPRPLPDAFMVHATLSSGSEAAVARGDFRVVLSGVFGPSGAMLLGRFCSADDALRDQVQRHLRAEEALEPDAVFAEIVHLPEGRLGNVLCRPLLRDHEIPYLGRSGASQDRQLPVSDLLVSVVGGRIILRSTRLQRQVIPRLTNAHNYTLGALGPYEFLCALQGQGVAGGLVWRWGPLEHLRFRPRVTSGRLVLFRARWRLTGAEARALGKAGSPERFEMMQRWRAEWRLPRLIQVADGDNLLVVDLDNILSIETFVDLVKGRESVTLEEMFPTPDDLCARGPEGRFVHELVIPFVRTRDATSSRPPRPLVQAGLTERCFPPGSEWISAKLYTGDATSDRVLADLVRPLIREWLDSRSIDRWFFIRYADPYWHLRLRLHGEPGALWGDVFRGLQDAVEPLLRRGIVWKLQLDTYEREVERYGGWRGIQIAEQVFDVDSTIALELLPSLFGDEGADPRWRLALCGADRLLADLELSLAERREIVGRLRDGLASELRCDKSLRLRLGDRFRRERGTLEGLLDPSHPSESPLRTGLTSLESRSCRLAPLVKDLVTASRDGELTHPISALAPSFVHMHLNRVLRSAHRQQEFVIYDFLHRLYEAQLSRAGGLHRSMMSP